MKILMTSDTFFPRLGGGEYHVHYVLTELRKLGHDVTLITTETMSPTAPDPPYVLRAKPGLRTLPTLLSILWRETGKADLVHAHYNYRLTFYVFIVAVLRRKPRVLTQHGLGLLPQTKTSFINDIAFVVWRRVGMMLASDIISTSDDLSITIRELGYGHKITLIPNGFDPEKFKPLQPSSGPPRLLTVRRLVPKTGIQYLIQILPRLHEKFPDLHVDIVGDGRLRSSLEAQASTLGVQDAVTFHGALPHEKILDYFKHASIVLSPSTAESTSLACIEAMALARTVVASRVGGLIELLGKNEERGYLVPITASEHSDYDAPPALSPEAADRLAKKIIDVLSAPADAQKKAEIASAYAREHFGWPKLVKKTVDEVFAPLVR